MHRLIVTSATYRQASKALAALDPARSGEPAAGARAAVPPAGRAGPRQRPGHRRAALARRSAGRRSSPTSRPGSGKSWPAAQGRAPTSRTRAPNLYRRSLYVYRKRTVPHPAMATFDAPSRRDLPGEAGPDQHAAAGARAAQRRDLRRGRQAPGPADADRGGRLAARTLDATPSAGPPPGPPSAGRAQGRPARGLDRYRQSFQADPGSAGEWLDHGESPATAGLDPIELAAYTATASVILNLDETITWSGSGSGEWSVTQWIDNCDASRHWPLLEEVSPWTNCRSHSS